MSHAGIKGFWIYGLGKSWAFYGLYLCSVDVSVIFFFNCFGLTLVHYLSLPLFLPKPMKKCGQDQGQILHCLGLQVSLGCFFFCCPHETFKTHPGVFGVFIGKRKGSYLSAGGLQGGKNKIASVWRE